MKKIYALIASVMLVTATSQAMAMDVNFNGTIREYLETDRVTGAGSNSTTSNENNRNPGVKLTNFISKLGITFVEPLNDVSPGLKLKGAIVTDFYADSPTVGTTNTGASNRSIMIGNNRSTVGFANDWFDVDFGRWGHMVWLTEAKYGNAQINGVGDQEGSTIGEIHARQKLRFNNGVFGSVKLGYGFTALANYSFSENAAVNDPYAVGLNYTNGPIDVQYVHFDVRDGIAKTDMLAGAYTFSNKARVSAIYSDDWYNIGNPNNTSVARTHTKGYSVTGLYPIDPKWSVEGSYGYRDDGVNAYGAGLRYYATRSITGIVQGQYVEADNPIFFTTPNDFAGVYGTKRMNLAVGMEVKF